MAMATPRSTTATRMIVSAGALVAGTLLMIAGCQSQPTLAPSAQTNVRLASSSSTNNPEVKLGARLFFEPKLSGDGTISCATCHQPDKGFADGRPVAVGINGKKGPRNTPTIYGTADMPLLMWDGRNKSLEEQALGPIENPVEMGAKLDVVLDRLNQDPTYRQEFQTVYGGPATRERLGRAIASFERALTLKPNRFDRFFAGDQNALTAQERRGWDVFRQARCGVCHAPPEFTDHQFHNLGQGTTLPNPDPGRMAVTGKQSDWAAFKTPSLRNVAKTAPYMHDGTLRTLQAVLALYHQGGIPNPNKDRLIQPFPFMPSERDDLIAFLQALSSDDNFNELVPPEHRRR